MAPADLDDVQLMSDSSRPTHPDSPRGSRGAAAVAGAAAADRPAPEPPDRGSDDAAAPNFLADIVAADLASNVTGRRLRTRFPPEPNGYLHIGHAKAIVVDFGLAERFGGTCNLRFDDTNPTTEETEYVEAIQQDVRWLGYDWQDRLFFASDYFDKLYEFALRLIQDGKAYVDSQSAEAIRAGRGTFYQPGTESPHRNRSVQENLELFAEMRAGKLPDGSAVLRAKIDMASPNLNLRDPPLYRIRHARHHRSGDAWCIYPMYDFAHGLCDAIEGITHSLCTLEFETHRPLYDWFLDTLAIDPRPRQIEFARLNLTYTILSKRRLQTLVQEGHVSGWDDPRMPTLAGLRRRGYTPEALRAFCERIGVSKKDALVDVSLLEHYIREDLNQRANRAMAVLRPLRLVITNYPEGQTAAVSLPNHPEYPERGTRSVPFGRVLFVEQDDFRKEAPKKWFRLAPGREVRLRGACLVTCQQVVEDAEGHIVELRCTWDPDSWGGSAPDGRKVQGTLHWVSAEHSVRAEARLYDRLFSIEDPGSPEHAERPLAELLSTTSVEVLRECRVEPSLAELPADSLVQFERLGYFCVDARDTAPGAPVFNRTIGLRDSWAKLDKQPLAPR